MADAVHGTRVPDSQTNPETASPTRRGLLNAVPAAAVALAAAGHVTAALASPAAVAGATDGQFLAWEREWNRYQDAFIGSKTDDEVDRLADEQQAFETLIFETPSATRRAAEIKARLLLDYARNSLMDDLVSPLEHILSALSGIGGQANV